MHFLGIFGIISVQTPVLQPPRGFSDVLGAVAAVSGLYCASDTVAVIGLTILFSV
jgi:hypothetical protein